MTSREAKQLARINLAKREVNRIADWYVKKCAVEAARYVRRANRKQWK